MCQGADGSGSSPQPPGSLVFPPEVPPTMASNCREKTEWGKPLPSTSLQSAAERNLNPVSVFRWDGEGKELMVGSGVGWGGESAQDSLLTRICSCPFLHESGESSLSSARHTPI